MLVKPRSEIATIMKMKHCMYNSFIHPFTHSFTHSYMVFQKALVTPNAVSPYPSLMKPSAPLLHTRLINAAIQAFSQLFVYSGSGSRGKMTEVVLNNMGQGRTEGKYEYHGELI